MRTTSDDDLVLEGRAGSAGALEELYRRWAPRLLAYAARATGDPALAEDVVQETFTWFFRNLERYRPEGRLGAYLFRIARSSAVDEGAAARKARGRGAIPDAPAPQPTEPTDPGLQTRIQSAMERLPAHLREVVVLRLFQDLDYATIGEVTGVSEATARSRMRYALEGLRAVLDAESAARQEEPE